MSMLVLVLLVLALVFAILATFGIPVNGINTGWAALAFLILSFIVRQL
jgi:hypothetical protein